MPEFNMSDLLDNILFEKPLKPIVKPIKESEIDVATILGEAGEELLDPVKPGQDGGTPAAAPEASPETQLLDPVQPEEDGAQQNVKPIPDEGPESGSLEEFVKKARKIAKEHEPDGDLVLEIALQLEGRSCGKLQIGSDEYETITGWKIIMDKFGIDYKQVPDAIKSFRIDCETKYSQTESDSVGISVELSSDGETLGIQVFYNEEGSIMDDLEQALNEFNRRYREYIITAINEKVRT